MIFLKNKGQLKNILHYYKVPEPDEKEIEDTVQLGQQQMRSLLPSRTTYSTLFKTQIRYITPYLLWAQLFIVALFIIFTLNISQPIKDLPKIIFLISPIFSLVAVLEMVKSEIYNMSVFEQTSKYSVAKIMLTRAIIANAINIITLTIILIYLSTHFQLAFLQLILYGLVPMNIMNGLSLLFIDVFQVRSKIILTAIYLSLFMLNFALVQSKFFLSLSYFTWFIIFILSTIIILIELYIFLTKMKNREKFQWN